MRKVEKIINAEAAPLRIERQFKKLNDYESDCVHSPIRGSLGEC